MARDNHPLIDDSASVREVLRVASESEGYRVIEAADGREGVPVDVGLTGADGSDRSV